MVEDKDILLASLLANNGITDFHRFATPKNCKIQETLYGYIKDDFFYICNSKLRNFSRKDIGLPEGILLVILSDDEYSVSDKPADESYILAGDCHILEKNPQKFGKLNSECYILDDIIQLCELKGVAIDTQELIDRLTRNSNFRRPEHSIWILPKGSAEELCENSWGRLWETDRRFNLPQIVIGGSPYVKEGVRTDLHYLFSVGEKNYFFNKRNKNITIIDQGNRWHISEVPMGFIWISKHGGHVVSIEPIFLKELEDLDKGCSYNVRANIDGYSTDLPRLRNAVNIRSSQWAFCTKDYLVIEIEHWKSKSKAITIINASGEITFSSSFNDSEIDFANNILRVKYDYSKEASYYSCNGIWLANTEEWGIVKTQIDLDKDNLFNSEDIQNAIYQLSTNHTHRPFSSNGITCYMGVTDLRTGRTLVPHSFSGVETYNLPQPYNYERYPAYKQLSIVWIDHFFNGIKSYFGVFLDENLILPIGYEEISFLKYEKYRSSSYCKMENTKHLYVKQNGRYGVYDAWCREILPISASSLSPLSTSEDTEYILAYNDNGLISLVYQNKIVCDFILSSAVRIPLKHLEYLSIVKISKNDKYALVCQGEVRTAFYDDIVFHEMVGYCKNFHENFVCIVSLDGKKGVVDSHGGIIFPIEYDDIKIQGSNFLINGIVYSSKKEALFNESGYDLFKTQKCLDEIIRVYRNSQEYVFIVEDRIIRYSKEDIKENSVSCQMLNYVYKFEEDKFEYVPEEDDSWSGYDYDDTDYDRETYYALGGDDYDAFKERGGNIDDMMDGMGY